MNYNYYKKSFPKDILVYIEEVNKEDNSIVFDFIDSNEYTSFINLIDSDNTLEKPSMVLLANYKGRAIQENTTYSINPETIRHWVQENLISSPKLDSYLIGYIIDTKNFTNIFNISVSFDRFSNLFINNHMYGTQDISNLELIREGKISLTVRNVGQGSWNEINFNNEPKIVYDAGAPMNYSKSEILALIGTRNNLYHLSKPILILSHWDKDHYHALLGMTNNEIKNNFSAFICRDTVPNLTSRLLFRKIQSSIYPNNTYSIPAENRITRKGPTYFKPLNSLREQIVIYNSQHHKNRNISGIAISVKTSKSSVILPGDAHYEQISRDILSHLIYPNQHNLIVPHHGGQAGRYSLIIPPIIKVSRAIISVGKNKYGHPISSHITSLRSSGFHVQQTNIIGKDIHLPL